MKLVDRFRAAWFAFWGLSIIITTPCDKEHVLPNHTVISDDRLRALEESTDELKFALGFISHAENQKYQDSMPKVIGHSGKR